MKEQEYSKTIYVFNRFLLPFYFPIIRNIISWSEVHNQLDPLNRSKIFHLFPPTALSLVDEISKVRSWKMLHVCVF